MSFGVGPGRWSRGPTPTPRTGPGQRRAPEPAQGSRGPVRGRADWAHPTRRAVCQTRRSTATTLPRMVASSPGIGS